MKKKIANAVQLVLLIASFILLISENITNPGKFSAITFLRNWSSMLIPMYVLYILCAVMCIISIISNSKYKDGISHGAVATLLFIYTMFVFLFINSGKSLNYLYIIETDFPIELFIGLSLAMVVVAFAKRSSFIAESKESKQTVVNNIQETTNADELKKYKDLLDSGAITQEEFDAKKKELLGL